MRIAFYAPLKPPDHEVPSGDRQMARQLMAALRLAGHDVELVSRLRSYATTPQPSRLAAQAAAAVAETRRLEALWAAAPARRPDLWFTYHPYYKAPDLVGPHVAAALEIPYATAEASYAGKRDRDGWAAWQRPVVQALQQGAVHFCLTEVDREGIAALLGDTGRLVDLPPFIDADLFSGPPPAGGKNVSAGPARLITAAMMRPGKKVRSYRFLADALHCLGDLDWRLTIVGDGAARDAVGTAFAAYGPRLRWLGECSREVLSAALRDAHLFVWPGFDEDYGMVYLEAQAAGCPVVALASRGVGRVVENGVGGLLVREPDPTVFARAIRDLVGDAPRRARMAESALVFARMQRTPEAAAAILDAGLRAARPGLARGGRADDVR